MFFYIYTEIYIIEYIYSNYLKSMKMLRGEIIILLILNTNR